MLTRTDTRLYGTAAARAWNRLRPRLTRRSAWIDHTAPLPIIEGTVIRLTVERLPSGGVNKPVRLWCSGVDADTAGVSAAEPRSGRPHHSWWITKRPHWRSAATRRSSRATSGPPDHTP